MKLLNREPTAEMIEAGWEALQNVPDHSAAVMFRGMYDAAPEIQQEPVAWAATSNDGVVEALGFNQSRTRFTTPLYTFPPDAQAEIAKRDERINELESEVRLANNLFAKRLIEHDYQAAEITKLNGVIAKCEKAIDSHLSPCGCFNGCKFCDGKATLEEALAAIKEEGL